MKKLLLIAGCAALAACGQSEEAAPADNANVAATEDANAAVAEANEAAPAAFSLNSTTWTYTQDGKATQTTVDANGNYVTTAGAEHVDHGTVAMTDGKACFTSAMDQEGPECWTIADTAVGASMDTTSDKGNKLTVTRVAYVAPAPMPQ